MRIMSFFYQFISKKNMKNLEQFHSKGQRYR